MADKDTPVVETPDYLGMSDEDILNAEAPVAIPADKVVVEPVVVDPVEEEDLDLVKDPADVVVPKDGDAEDDDADQAEEALRKAAAAKALEGGAKDKTKPKEGDAKVELTHEEKQAAADKLIADKLAVAINFEAEYNRLLAPFKANGRDIQVKSVDDAISLMQMGANYNKKMGGLKPALKLLKLLENNGLMSEEKISWLIDLDKKNPEAINKLVKDSGLNPMDFDAEKAGEYKTKIHTVDDREIALDTVLEEIQETPSYTRTLKIVSKEWDGPSKQVISEQPQLLKVINDHVTRGIYDLISTEVESERMLGRLTGLSDLDAYKQVGDVIQARGGFDHLGSSQKKPSTTAPVVVTPKPKTAEEDERDKKRRAASSSRSGAPSTAAAAYNPLNLPDDEFMKLATPKY